MTFHRIMTRGLAVPLVFLTTSAFAGAEQAVAPTESAHGGSLQASIMTLGGQVIASANEQTRSDSPFLLTAGDEISICVKAQQQGFISVWSRTPTDSHLERLYPNSYTHGDDRAAAAIGASKAVCLGTAEDPYRIRVASDKGASEVYVMWTKTAADQLESDDVVVISDRTVPPPRPRAIAATTMTYQVK